MTGQRATFILVVATTAWCAATPDSATIISRSVEANNADWKAAPAYDYTERDRTAAGTRTYRVMTIEGSPYQELLAVNGEPLPSQEQATEQHKLEQVRALRRAESAGDRARRIERYEQERKRDHLIMQELTRAMDFTLLGERRLGGYEVYLLQATPRPGYRPPTIETEVLTGMQGKLWIDKQTYQWVKVEAQVVRPVSIAGFLASVLPGTRFELEMRPAGEGLWLPAHFAMKSKARILHLFPHRSQADETYFDYRKSAAGPPE